jgi:hypothetical protein
MIQLVDASFDDASHYQDSTLTSSTVTVERAVTPIVFPGYH